MSARPVVGGIYQHPGPFRFPVLVRVITANDTAVIVRPTFGRSRLPFEVTRAHFDRCFRKVDDGDKAQVAGQQPVSEFTAAPTTGTAATWDDARLHAELDRLEGRGPR